jgi:uncharacterized protein (TIGR00255 family)
MTNSMTGFARVQQQIEAAQLCWEVKSVNHRYLDCSFRLPEELRFLEPSLRSVVANYVVRGKLECQLKLTGNPDEEMAMLINKGLVRSLLGLGNELAAIGSLENDLSVSELLAWPGVVQKKTHDDAFIKEAIVELFSVAMKQLAAGRATEGSLLKEYIEQRLKLLKVEIDKARELVKNNPAEAKSKLLAKLSRLNTDVPEERIAQELALILTRLDVSEELDRLDAHCHEVKKALSMGQSTGRKLDFLMQELNREANTLGSKSDSTSLTNTSVEMKVLIEQMREQIQNIE